jgi:hypothetical protein
MHGQDQEVGAECGMTSIWPLPLSGTASFDKVPRTPASMMTPCVLFWLRTHARMALFCVCSQALMALFCIRSLH